jgi:hypothetical protein
MPGSDRGYAQTYRRPAAATVGALPRYSKALDEGDACNPEAVSALGNDHARSGTRLG